CSSKTLSRAGDRESCPLSLLTATHLLELTPPPIAWLSKLFPAPPTPTTETLRIGFASLSSEEISSADKIGQVSWAGNDHISYEQAERIQIVIRNEYSTSLR